MEQRRLLPSFRNPYTAKSILEKDGNARRVWFPLPASHIALKLHCCKEGCKRVKWRKVLAKAKHKAQPSCSEKLSKAR